MLWGVLILLGILLILWATVNLPGSGALAVAVCVFAFWALCAWGYWHLYGIRRSLFKHLGLGWNGLRFLPRASILKHPIKAAERVDLQLALDHLRQAAGNTPVFAAQYFEAGLVNLITNNPYPAPIAWEALPRSLTETVQCAKHIIYLLRHQNRPYCVMVSPREQKSGRTKLELEVLALDPDTARGALAEIQSVARERSVFRGAVISLERTGDREEPYEIKFYDLPKIDRQAIILPEAVMQVVERNVLGLLEHGDTLRAAGQNTRHGVLLHGPPGTGKTLVTKYLARACRKYTVILLTGRQLRFVRESCQLARLLAPSMLVMEDVDLVASERGKNRNTTLLHELMDEMDGLGPKTDCIFLLTTNRAEVLEPALAARPGRVDQAIYFPLPDLDCRRRLFAQFAARLDLSQVDLEPWLERTAGASPAFLQEFVRKAALLAAERGERTPLALTTSDFEQALRELIEFGGALTRNLLGFRPDSAPRS